MPLDTPQSLTSDQDTQRVDAARRLKSAQRSMIVSAVITVLLLVATIAAFISGHYSTSDNRSQTSIFGVFAAVILLRFAYRGWRLYSTWRSLKDAQNHHRSLQ